MSDMLQLVLARGAGDSVKPGVSEAEPQVVDQYEETSARSVR
ncbi:MAG TPA: hypothetical protein VJU86_14535 [Pyrinomonadaceae bacterium]|nr:hypothetical protein [Pyrinomonadaceae bacterium]